MQPRWYWVVAYYLSSDALSDQLVVSMCLIAINFAPVQTSPSGAALTQKPDPVTINRLAIEPILNRTRVNQAIDETV